MFDVDKIALIAQKISFAYEDLFEDEKKRNLFVALFQRYLDAVDPEGKLEIYDATILLARKEPGEFDRMIKEMKDNELISD